MKETALWRKLDPVISKRGKFQKISDQFTGGIPDVLGALVGTPVAIELKELKGVRVIRTKFRPGQLDWLEDWSSSGGLSLILTTHGLRWLVFSWAYGVDLESGVSPEDISEHCLWEGIGKGVEEKFCRWLEGRVLSKR